VKQSKYIKAPSEIFNMTTDELKDYLRKGWKTIETKIRRTRKSEFADFSELLNEFETLQNRWGGIFTGASKGLTKHSLQRKALDLASLFNITETPSQLNAEGERNIKNFFKEPRYTKQFIEHLNRNQKILAKLVNQNDSFIREIVASDQISEIFNSDKSEEEQYRDMLLTVSEHLDLRDNEEKEKLINEKFNPVFEAVGNGQWKDIESGEIIDVNEKW